VPNKHTQNPKLICTVIYI